MKKTLITVLLFCSLPASAGAQDLSKKYFTLCNEFLTFFRAENRLGVTDSTYIWSQSKNGFMTDLSYYVSQSKPWVCYADPDIFWVGPRGIDTVKFSSADMQYLAANLGAKRNNYWRNKLATATGLLANEPWQNPSITDYVLLTPPLFLQNNTVCVVYFETNTSHYDHSSIKVYKKDRLGWAFIGDRLWSHGCKAERPSKNSSVLLDSMKMMPEK